MAALKNKAWLLAMSFPAATTADAQAWIETRATIETLADAGAHNDALDLGEQLVALAEAEFGSSSVEVAESHRLLAEIDRRDGQYFSAVTRMLTALEIYRGIEGANAPALIEPYVALGDLYQAGEEYPLAMSAYEQAQAISRRAYGLTNPDQVEMLHKMADSAEAMQQPDEAIELRREALEIVGHAFGEGAPEHLAAYYELAESLREHRRYSLARGVYSEILAIVDERYDGDPLMRVEALRKSADTFRRMMAGDDLEPFWSEAEPVELEEALDLIAALPSPDPLLRAQVLQELGDWNVAFERVWDIEATYLKAWELLAASPAGEELKRAWATDVTLVYSEEFGSRHLSAEPDAPWGRIELQFTIEPDGRAKNIEIIEADPADLVGAAATHHVETSRFRPRVVAGKLAATTGVVGLDYQYKTE